MWDSELAWPELGPGACDAPSNDTAPNRRPRTTQFLDIFGTIETEINRLKGLRIKKTPGRGGAADETEPSVISGRSGKGTALAGIAPRVSAAALITK